MKPKFICDGCGESLQEKQEDGDYVYILSDNINGFSVMEHNNIDNKIVLCEACSEEAREKLKEEEAWMDLEMWDSHGYCESFFEDWEKLKHRIVYAELKK